MPQSGIRDNRSRGSVGEFLKQTITPESELLFLSAYFTVYAYKELREQLDSIKGMRFLFGEPTFVQQKNILESRNFNINKTEMVDRENNTSDELAYGVNLDDRLGQSSIARQCVKWITEKVEIRSMVKPNFLHGKLYHITESNRREMSIMGSSNFTYNGLGFGDSRNIEMNLITDSNRDIEDIKNWFLELWNDKTLTVDVKEEVIKYLNQYYKENSPESIYYFTLSHIFDDYLSVNQAELNFENQTEFVETDIWKKLYDFQKNAVKSAVNILAKYNGCIIADSVGLGKTFEALAVIKYYESRGKDVLVLCPKRLSENWKIFTRKDEKNFLQKDNFRYEVRYHTDLGRDGKHSDGSDLNSFTWGKFDLVVIDESHNFRNNRYSKTMTRYEWLLENVIKQGRQTKVLMLSATPVNNKLTDLRNQINLATQGKDYLLETEGIKNINYTLVEAQKIFNEWAKIPENSRKVDGLIERLANTDFYKLLDTLTIARSRTHIKNHFDTDAVGEFPERLNPYSVYANIDTQNNFISYEEINCTFEKLNLAIFAPFAFIKEEHKRKYQEKYYTKTKQGSIFTQEDRESHLVGMMKINYLKRLESSIESFNLSIERLIKNIENMISIFDAQHKTSEVEYADIFYNGIEDEDIEEELFIGKKIKISVCDIKHKWREKLCDDLVTLKKLYNQTCVIEPSRDNKLIKLKEIIKEKVLFSSVNGEYINKGNKKIIVFTAFSDTAEYIYKSIRDFCCKELDVHIGLVVGSGSCKTTFNPTEYKANNDYNTILTNFSPVSKYRSAMKNMPQNDEIEILIATDCISEGQNLQDCDCVVNYDIHWNPVRILQRFGRVDRISSSIRRNKKVKLINFWATEDLNGYIRLNERVKAKMAIVGIAATGDEGSIIEELEAEKYSLSFREKQLLRMKDEICDIENLCENVSLTEFNFNDFRMDIINYSQNNCKSFARVPKGIYAVCPSTLKDENQSIESLIKPGVIFCLKRKIVEQSVRKSNPIEPYYLMYVYDSGEVKIGYTNIKNVLSIYRSLCLGHSEPYEELCDFFNKKTFEASNMDFVAHLLNVAIKSISKEAMSQSLKSLTFDRSLKMFASENIKMQDESFELISFLVIL